MNRYRSYEICTAILLAVCAATAQAQSQPVYLCGNSYSQQPCPGAATVEVDDSRSAAQQDQTGAAVQRDMKAAKALEESRLKEEAKASPGYVPPAKEEPPAADAPKPETVSGKATKPRYFTAVAPRKPGEPVKKKKKAKKKTA